MLPAKPNITGILDVYTLIAMEDVNKGKPSINCFLIPIRVGSMNFIMLDLYM